MDFSTPPDPLTKNQRAIVLIAALACALTRLLAVARSVWEWDEALFTMAMRDYDVTLHHPHPPGFPVFIAMARLIRPLVQDDFRALQTVNVIAAMLVFVAVFLFARELRLRFSTCLASGVLFAFFPNVWFFGGGAFSDVPSIVLVLFAVIFLLRGVRDRRAYWAGTLLMALAIGIRPQNLLVGLAPGILATRRRRGWEVFLALTIGIVVVGTAFGAAAWATGSLDGYLRMVREHGEYISRVDSFRSEGRPPLWRIADRFFVKQYQSALLSVVASLFVMVSVIGSVRERSRPMLWNVLTFGPFAVLAWLMLDRYSISRFSIGYQPMFALLAADGMRRVAGWSSRRFWGDPARRAFLHEGVLVAAVAGSFFVYTLPALQAVRRDIAPSVRAAEVAVRAVNPATDQLFVGHTMMVFVDLVAPGFPYTRVSDDGAIPILSRERSWLLAEVTKSPGEGMVFARERGRLWNIARRHYFEIKLAPLRARPGARTGKTDRTDRQDG